MKKMWVICIAFLIVFAVACSKKTNQEQQPQSSGNPIEQYGGVMSKTLKTAKNMDVVLPVKQLVDSFYVQEGRYPTTLQELIEKNYAKQIPQPPKGYQYKYDSSTGNVELQQIGSNQ